MASNQRLGPAAYPDAHYQIDNVRSSSYQTDKYASLVQSQVKTVFQAFL